jgi:hypothetical protein
MKQAKLAVVAMLMMVFSSMAVAQTIGSSTIVANVPFKFVVGNRTVPAGEWKVQAISQDGKTLMIHNGDAKVSLFTSSSQAENRQSAAHYALVFKRYGDRYFLAGVKIEGSKISYLVPESEAEMEMRAQNTPSSEETLVATLR